VGDAPPADEPPFDPDYDTAPADRVAAYEGFDPGDEPLDDAVDPSQARESSEDQAVRLLKEQLGAERIGD
jgi:DNA polymerase-3 subunit gamma/tau